MTFTFPRLVFAKHNTPKQQVVHILSEASEVLWAWLFSSREHLDEEISDLMQSCSTYWEIRVGEWQKEGKTGYRQLAQVAQERNKKNAERGYVQS